MASGSDRVSIKLNVFDGTIEIDASSADFQVAVDKAKELAVATQLGSRPHTSPAPETPNTLAPANHQPPAPSAGDSAPAPSKASAGDRKPKAARSSGGSQSRPGRIGSFEPVKFGLSEADERALRDFVKEKAPVEQGHQVAVAMMKGEEILGRQGLEYNEIYTLMHLGGIKPLPKAIDVVLGKLAGENWVVREGKTFSLKFVGRDFVTEKLPPQKAP
jgi:hypothetical protein